MKKVLCIDNSVASSPAKRSAKYLYLSLLQVGNEYTVTKCVTSRVGLHSYKLEGIPDDGLGYSVHRFIDITVDETVEEVAGELCN